MSTVTTVPTAGSVDRDNTCETVAKDDMEYKDSKSQVTTCDVNSDVEVEKAGTSGIKVDTELTKPDVQVEASGTSEIEADPEYSNPDVQIETEWTKIDLEQEQSKDEKKSCDSNENIKLIDLTIVHVNEDEIPEKKKSDDLNENIESTSSSVTIPVDESETLKEEKDISDDSNEKNIKSTDLSTTEVKDETSRKLFKMPVVSKPSIMSRRQIFSPIPILSGRPLILATHLVPSFPINLFELLAEVIEYATERPVVLLYEGRSNRAVVKEITDIAILPANDDWKEGALLPVSFVFEHRLNKEKTPCVYSDVVLVADRAPHAQEITDLRGHRCALSDRHKRVSAAHLLFDHLRSKGEGPAFFGSIVDADSQLNALQIIAGKLVEVGILEAPVLKCHSLPGMESLRILTSLGPLPPYRFMINKDIPDTLVRKITDYLSNINQCTEWLERFAQYGVIGFAENHADLYDVDNTRSVVTSVPYY